jgi:geranylgeranyl diphosphate synthase type II
MPSNPSLFLEYAGRTIPLIDAALTRALDAVPAGCPPLLRDAMRYSLLAPGKRVRPLLVLLAAEACGGRSDEAMPAACAVEMIHAYSLVHDDLPAMDDDDLRRGRPTNHKVFGEGQAILAGDALLTLAFEILPRDIRQPEKALACIRILAEASGPSGMAGGQSDDLAAEDSETKTIETLLSIHGRKTGKLIEASLLMGATIAEADASHMEALSLYGRRLGLLFQVIDDLLDVTGTEETAGKRVGKDSVHGKMTFPGLLGIEETKRRAEELHDEARRVIEDFHEKGQLLGSLVEYVARRRS